jgi:methyl-accepting chemotaxis protein
VGGIAEINTVAQVIQEVSAVVASIAAASEEQAAATKENARNIAEATAGLADQNAPRRREFNLEVCKSANSDTQTWKFRRSASAAWA